MSIRKRLANLLRGEPLQPPRFGTGFGRLIPGSDIDDTPIKSKREAAETYAGWVFAASSFIAEEVRSAEWGVWRKDGRSKNQWRELPDHPLARILERPNTTESWGDLIERSDISFSVAGEYFWHVIRDNTRPIGIQLVLPHWVDEPTFDREGRHAGWRVTVPGRPMRVIPAEDMIRVYRPHPMNPWMAASIVEAGAVSHYFDLYLRAYGMTLFRNDGGVPAGVLSTDQDVTPAQATDIQERWRQRYSQSRGEIAVLGANAKYEPIGIPMHQLKFLEIGEFTRDQVLQLFRVPPALLGNAGDVNRASIDGHLYSFQRHALRPRLSRYAEAVRTRVAPLFAGERESRQLWFEFSDVVMQDRDQIRTEARESLEAGAITVNEYRERLDMDPTRGGDVYMLPNTHTPSTTLEPQEPQQEPARASPDPTAGLVAAAARKRADIAEKEAKRLRIEAAERRHYQDLRGLFASWWRNRSGDTLPMTGLDERGLTVRDLPDVNQGETLHDWVERLKGPEGKRLARMLAEREEA